MQSSVQLLSRRSFMRVGTSGLCFSFFSSCAKNLNLTDVPNSDVDTKVHLAMRQEWTGKEIVVGVMNVDDRYLMVRGKDGLGWSFPHGEVDARIHGEKDEDNRDLVRAATEYAHTQSLVAVIGNAGTILAYGYAIDEHLNRLLMVHWIKILLPTQTLPRPHANLSDTLEVKWVGFDDPILGACLQNRMSEMKKANQGGTILWRPCLI